MKRKFTRLFIIVSIIISMLSSYVVVEAINEQACIATTTFNGHTYKLYNIDTSWIGAEKFCENVGGHLATITTEKENQVIYDFLSENGIVDVYLGATDVEDEGNWLWVTGESWSFENWASGEPNNQSNNENYLMFYHKSGDKWNDGDGNVKYFLCEIDNLLADAEKNSKKIIFMDSEIFGGNHYKIFDNRMSWYDAKEYCESLGGHLVTITSQEEQNFIESMLQGFDGEEFFIGLHRDIDNFGSWVTGEKVIYSNWGENEPDNAYGGQEIGVIATSHSDSYSNVGHYVINKYQWDDNKDGNRKFICEWEEDEITIIINGNKIVPKQAPVIIGGTTLVHIRTFENVGAKVDWDDDSQTATVKKGNKIVKAQLGKTSLNINGVDTPYAGIVPTQLINECTMVPLRAIIEAMGGVVNWYNDTKTINIYYSSMIDYIINNSDKKSELLLASYEIPDARTIFNNYEYCYDYMEKYYDNEFLTAFSIAFDDPTLPIKTLVESVFDFSNMPNYREVNKNIDLASVYTKKQVAECLAATIDKITEDEIELDSVNEEVKTIISKIKSTTGLILNEDNSIEGMTIFKNFLKGMSFGIKVIDTSSDIVEGALSDYGRSYAYLEAFETALNESGLMNVTLQDAIDEIRLEYDAWFIKQFQDILNGKISDEITSTLGKVAGKGAYGFVTFAWDALNISSKNDERSTLLVKINSYMIYDLPLSRSYSYYANKIYSGDYTANDVLQCERVFELCKATRINEYNSVLALDKVDRIGYNTIKPERFNKDTGVSEEELLRTGITILENLSY